MQGKAGGCKRNRRELGLSLAAKVGAVPIRKAFIPLPISRSTLALDLAGPRGEMVRSRKWISQERDLDFHPFGFLAGGRNANQVDRGREPLADVASGEFKLIGDDDMGLAGATRDLLPQLQRSVPHAVEQEKAGRLAPDGGPDTFEPLCGFGRTEQIREIIYPYHRRQGLRSMNVQPRDGIAAGMSLVEGVAQGRNEEGADMSRVALDERGSRRLPEDFPQAAGRQRIVAEPAMLESGMQAAGFVEELLASLLR